MVFRSARLEGYLVQDPAEGVKTAKIREPLTQRRSFTLDELRAILDAAGPEWQSLIKFGLYTGQRLSDLAALTWAQIDLARDEIRITTRKTAKSLLLPIATPLREHLVTIANADDPLAPVHPHAYEIIHSQKGRVATLSNEFALLMVAAGLRQARDHGRTHRKSGFARSTDSER